MPHRFSRSKRVADQIKRDLAAMFMGEIKDPRIAAVMAVMHVDVSEDLRYAKVFVSVMGGPKEQSEVLAGLRSAGGFIRSALASRIDIRRVPELQFLIDHSLEDRARIEMLINRAKEREKA
ncbi:MAG: 30S ribosome-binding factor RbfA [Dissulfurimicrobium sp.]|uniref:30S ribosome-binding factor RbfA n=1 Tax=Dissulfurimicrobium TaxID=1769732 RepID=UPI001ED9FC71|nr:30S ribosome-binding factor RbfA [Dissulfurimicrobium hydrothermale]UKL14024.1 30S ribosome-binding factor RbfA [Dissulfurimicrobium hydrothermale]